MRTKLRDKRLYWRGSFIWCRVLGPLGVIDRKSTKCRTEEAASAVANGLERRAADPAYAAAATATLGGALTALFADLDRRRRSDATKKKARQKVGHFVRLWGEELPLVKVTSALVLEYIDKRQGETAADITIKDELGHLGQALKLARHAGSFHLEVSSVLPPFFSANHTPRDRWPTPAEMSAVVAELPSARAAHLVYILATGCRREESFRARRSDTDWTTRLVHVHGTKTEASDDDVPVTRVTEPFLRWALERAPGKDVLFWPWGNLNRDLAAACARAGIGKLTPNDLRRGFGKWHVLAGVSQNATSKLLRHTTDKLAQTTYARVTGQEVADLVDPQIRALPEVAFLRPGITSGLGGGACKRPGSSPGPETAANVLQPAGVPADAGTLLGVPNLYAETTQTDPNEPQPLHESPGKEAPPREFESPTNALGKRSPDTPFEAEFSGDRADTDRPSVSDLYARVRANPPRKRGVFPLAEATANLYELLAARGP